MGDFRLVVQGDYSSQLTIGGVQRKESSVRAFQGINQRVAARTGGGWPGWRDIQERVDPGDTIVVT